ncbi:hypothetical protein C2S51_038736 [Perilla frutescens var. frutescens]|nr:hypothetical protein C2S51_038736 [Perilla frutescens var. frutescens]
MAEVSFICKRTVINTKPVEPGKFSPLSVLDRIMEHNHLRLVFYYNLLTRRRPGELTKKLRESISEMLSAFPVVVGRLLRTPEGHWSIKCNDAGVRMVEAKVNGTVEEWLQNVDRERELKLVYWEEMSHKPYFWSTFYVQITEFECGGLAIGLSCTHMLSDPICATMLIKAWADTTLRGEITSPPLFLPLPSPTQGNNKPNLNWINHYKTATQGSSALISETKQATISLHFNEEMVRNCIAIAGAGLTPFEALTALFWTRISSIKGVQTGLADMCICLDTRQVLGLDRSFFGNCMMCKKVVQLQGDESGLNRVAEAAALIQEAVSRMERDEVMELIEWLEREKCQNPPLMNGANLVCVNLESVGSYSVVFEENAMPLRASYYIEPAGGAGQLVVLPAGGGGGGRVVAVTLAEDEAQKLLEDALIQQFAPTVIMGFNKKVS